MDALLQPAIFTAVTEVDPTTIEWLRADGRVGAVRADSTASSCSFSTPEWDAALGALPDTDAYYYSGLFYTDGEFYFDERYAERFLAVARSVDFFVTNAALDSRVWTPALPPALASYTETVEDVLHDTSPREGTERTGWMQLRYRDGVVREVRFPQYESSGHEVSVWQPAELSSDIRSWLDR